MSKIIFLFLAVVAYSQARPNEEATTEKWHFLGHEFDRNPLADAVDKASVKMLKETYSETDDKNVISAPLGVLLLLSMYSAGAGESVRKEIAEVLGVSNYDELFSSYSRLSSRFISMDADYLTLANKVYVDQKFELSNKFATDAVREYNSEIEKVNFSDPPSAVAAINRWADEKTKGHIKNAVSEDSISADVITALVNVIFFQGHWDIPFNASKTKEQDFYVDKTNTVKKPMMRLEYPLFYHESPELGAKLIELPYREHGFRMVVVLPDEVDGLQTLIENVEKRGLMPDVFSLMPGNDILLEMPKFEMQTNIDLNSILPKMGVSKIFTDAAPGIVKGSPVVVSKAFQKAFVKVDEEGATAGAFTGAVAVPTSSFSSPPPPKVFKADHPFLFAILHEEILLFVGTYAH